MCSATAAAVLFSAVAAKRNQKKLQQEQQRQETRANAQRDELAEEQEEDKARSERTLRYSEDAKGSPEANPNNRFSMRLFDKPWGSSANIAGGNSNATLGVSQ